MATILKTPYFDAEDMVSVTLRLSDVLTQEIGFLENMDIAATKPLQEEKIKLLSLLENYSRDLRKNPDLLSQLPQATRDRLREKAKAFETIVTEDGRQLTKARRAHALVLAMIKEALWEKHGVVNNYTRSGNVPVGGTHHRRQYMPPVSLDERI